MFEALSALAIFLGLGMTANSMEENNSSDLAVLGTHDPICVEEKLTDQECFDFHADVAEGKILVDIQN